VKAPFPRVALAQKQKYNAVINPHNAQRLRKRPLENNANTLRIRRNEWNEYTMSRAESVELNDSTGEKVGGERARKRKDRGRA